MTLLCAALAITTLACAGQSSAGTSRQRSCDERPGPTWSPGGAPFSMRVGMAFAVPGCADADGVYGVTRRCEPEVTVPARNKVLDDLGLTEDSLGLVFDTHNYMTPEIEPETLLAFERAPTLNWAQADNADEIVPDDLDKHGCPRRGRPATYSWLWTADEGFQFFAGPTSVEELVEFYRSGQAP